MTKTYDSTVARIAGNLLADDVEDWLVGGDRRAYAVRAAVETARAIIAETTRTEPVEPSAQSSTRFIKLGATKPVDLEP